MLLKPVCLLGFMGAGKSKWGKLLAKRMHATFLDLDGLIETHAGMPVTEIFELQGEVRFRVIETECLRDALLQPNSVIALGGGTPCYADNITLLKEKSLTVYLKANAGMLANRLTLNYQSRPLLKHLQALELRDFIEKKLSERETYYAQADVIIEAENLSVEKLLAAITNHALRTNN